MYCLVTTIVPEAWSSIPTVCGGVTESVGNMHGSLDLGLPILAL